MIYSKPIFMQKNNKNEKNNLNFSDWINKRLEQAIDPKDRMARNANANNINMKQLFSHMQLAHDSSKYYRKQMKSALSELDTLEKVMGEDPSYSTRKRYEKRIARHSKNLRISLNKFAVDVEVFNRLRMLVNQLGIEVQ